MKKRTMKKLMRVAALLLAVCLLAGCSLIEIDESKIIVAKVGEKTITKTEFDESLKNYLALYGYTPESSDIQEQLPEMKTSYLEAMVDNLVIDIKAEEMGFVATQEEIDAAYQEAQDWYDEQFASLVEIYEADETIEDPEQHATEIIENHMTTYGYASLDAMAEETIAAIPGDKLYEDVVKDITVTEEEIQAEFDANVASDEETYAEDLATFVQDYNGGMTLYWRPEGLFFVKHILVALTEEQQDEISTLRAEGSDEEADSYREEALASLDAKVAEIQEKINAGEDFQTLIDEYGEDPGMQEGATAYEDGYLVYVGSEGLYMDEFARACDNLTKEGDISEPVATDYGYHIIRRCADLPSGAIELSEVHDLLNAKLLSSKQSEAYDEALQSWKEEMTIELFESRL